MRRKAKPLCANFAALASRSLVITCVVGHLVAVPTFSSAPKLNHHPCQHHHHRGGGGSGAVIYNLIGLRTDRRRRRSGVLEASGVEQAVKFISPACCLY